MRRRLFWSLLSVAGLALVSVTLLSAVATRQSEALVTGREMARAAAEIGEAAAERLASVDSRALLSALRAGSPRGLALFLEDARRISGARRAEIGLLDPAGVLHTGGEAFADLPLDLDALVAGEDVFVRSGPPGDRSLVLAHPVRRLGGDGPLLVLLLERALEGIDWASMVRQLVVPLAIAAALSAVAARWLATWLSSRLSALSTAAAALAGGDSAARAPVEGDDEIADVARAFNEMADRLDEINEREREFLMSVGHDLRTPLTTIAGYAEALDEGRLDPSEQSRIAAVLHREIGLLRRLIEDVTLLARLEAREFTLRPEAVDVAAHLAETAEAFRPRAEQARVRLTVRVEPTGLRPVDPDRLAQIASNLLENALRYTPEAGEVGIAVGGSADEVVIEVWDSGPGIDPDDLPRVFDKFYVAQRYRRVRPEGSGLGLAIVKQLVDAMGGSVEATSRPDQGTQMRVVLPAA